MCSCVCISVYMSAYLFKCVCCVSVYLCEYMSVYLYASVCVYVHMCECVNV